jgi:hypothetical protein
MRLTQLTEKTGMELTNKGCKYLRLLTTVTRNNKQYLLYEPTRTVQEHGSITEVLQKKGNNTEVYVCM